jgi:hypothetical protein
MDEEKIVQIMPINQKLVAVYTEKRKDGTEEKFTSPIIAIGLTEEGDVVFMDYTEGDGIIEPVKFGTPIKEIE